MNDGSDEIPPVQRVPVVGTPGRHNVRRSGHYSDFLSTIIAVVAALGLAAGLISFVFQSYQVDGPSMESTLQNNDRLIVWKVPRTWARFTHHQYVPNRGDVIIFNEAGLAAFGQASVKQLVKRVIGLPGERVVVKDGHVTIYNKQHPAGFDPDKSLPYGSEHSFPVTAGDIDTVLGPDQIFVCGDNRTDSLDSRAFGPVGLHDVVGKLVLRIFPINTLKRF